jgi:hypothetical protein
MEDWLPELSNEPFAEQTDLETTTEVSVESPRRVVKDRRAAEFGREQTESARIGVAADVDWETFQELQGTAQKRLGEG